MNRCPICHARLQMDANDDAAASTMCCRCGSALHHLLSIEQQAHQWLVLAIYRFINHDTQDALACLKHSLFLRQSELTRYLYDFIDKREPHLLQSSTYSG